MVLDTNAISSLAEGDMDLLRVLRVDRPWYLPSIALGEYRFGLMRSNRRVPLETWLEVIEDACTVLMPNEVTARHYAEIRDLLERAHRPVPYHDIWIAALAVQHELPVVSRDAL
jgi:predicted nucleic acid-binding protein